MALQFRAFFPYTLSGVLAIIGWWWFFSRKKNRMDNRPDCPLASGQDQLAENTQKDYISAEELTSSGMLPIQRSEEEFPQNCHSHSRSSCVETHSESSTFENVLENLRVSKVGDETMFTTQHLVKEDHKSVIGVLEEEPKMQETLTLKPLECSDFGTTQELYSVMETENVICEDVNSVPIESQPPEDSSLKTVEFEVVDRAELAVLEEKAVSSDESQEMSSVGSDAKSVALKDANTYSQMFTIEEKADEPSGHTAILPRGKELQNASVVSAVSHPIKSTETFSPFSTGESVTLEEMLVQNIDFRKAVSTGNVGHTEAIEEKDVQHSDFSEIASKDNVSQIPPEEKAVYPSEDSAMPTSDLAVHLLHVEENAVAHRDCSGNVSPIISGPTVLHQEKSYQPTEATEIISANCVVPTVLLDEKVVQLAEMVSDNSVVPTIIQEKALQVPVVTEFIPLDECSHIILEEKAVQAAEINETTRASKSSHIEEKPVPCLECKEVDSSDKVAPPLIEMPVQLTELNEIVYTEKPSVTGDQEIQLDHAEIICTDAGNTLILDNSTQLTKHTDVLSAEQVLQTIFLEEKNHPAELTKIVSSATASHSAIFEQNLIPHAAFPITSPKDASVAAVEEKTVHTTECSTIPYADKVSQNECRKTLSAGRDTQTSSINMKIDFSEKDTIVVGMLLNSYVEATPSLIEDNGCERDTFSQCLEKVQHFEGSEPVVDDLAKPKETDFAKREAEVIEQMAVKIVSQVILSATREILSGAVVDMSGMSCHVLENGTALPGPLSAFINVVESSGQNTIVNKRTTVDISLLAEENHVNEENNVNASKNTPLTNPNQANKPKSVVHKDRHESNLSELPILGESFEETIITAEDSGCSACTSEDGVIVGDLLHSTTLSCIVSSTPHFDALNSSEIGDTSLEQSVPSTQTLVSSKLQDNRNVPFSNGELKRNSPDSRQEGHWSTETEADHSGGSDVNSMDSVDSGCALGKTGSPQDVKPGFDSKKSDLAIWEIEVPKHLVGRLIGKQGRYVSFLKQTSGAKIYISTLPYTQEFQICHIEGAQPQVDRALSLIGKKFKELSLTNLYAPPPLTLPSLPMTSWLMLPDGVTVEVIVVNVVNAGHMFVQQHTHPTFHALRSLDQQMYLCYSQPGIPVLPTPVEVGVICAAPGNESAWWRAQVVSFCKESNEVEIRYVDYGGYERVKVDILRQIRSDFVTLPFQGSEVLLDNVIPLPDEAHFSSEADVAINEMTRGTALLAQVTNYDSATGLPLIQLWSMLGDEVVSINRALVERGFAQWIDGY